jgi:hypothetical protein
LDSGCYHIFILNHTFAMDQDFREIAHSGGKITFTIKTDAQGRHSYQIGVTSSRPVPMSMIAVYALGQGVPVASINLGGIGQAWNPPPFPGCYPVMIQSDSNGKFGHHCPQCDGYWRSGPWPNVCPYCNAHGEGYQFLSNAQRDFIVHYCEVLTSAIADIENGEVGIDMDEVADAAELKPEERLLIFRPVRCTSTETKKSCWESWMHNWHLLMLSLPMTRGVKSRDTN